MPHIGAPAPFGRCVYVASPHGTGYLLNQQISHEGMCGMLHAEQHPPLPDLLHR